MSSILLIEKPIYIIVYNVNVILVLNFPMWTLILLLLRATAGTAIARLSHRNSVRPSVRPSVCHTGGSGKNGAS